MKRTLLIAACSVVLVLKASPILLAVTYAVTDLGILGGDTGYVAFGISDSGLVVGSVQTSDGWDHAFLYDGTMNDLGAPPGGYLQSYGNGVNDAGQVVGSAYAPSVLFESAFLYDGHGTIWERCPADGPVPRLASTAVAVSLAIPARSSREKATLALSCTTGRCKTWERCRVGTRATPTPSTTAVWLRATLRLAAAATTLSCTTARCET